MFGIETMEDDKVSICTYDKSSDASREFAFAVARAKQERKEYWFQQTVTGLQYIRLVEYYDSNHFKRSVKQVLDYWEPER